jgi:hypothetical protein
VVRPTAGDARDQAVGRNVRGKKWGGRKVYGWGEKMVCCVLGGRNKREEKKRKQNKRKSWPAARGWVGRKKRERERERERKEKKKRPAASYLAGWGKKKKKGCCVPAGWVGERKERERKKKKKKRPAVHVAGWEKEKGGTEKKKKKNPVVTFQKVKRYQWSPKIKNFNVISNLIVWLAFFLKKKY